MQNQRKKSENRSTTSDKKKMIPKIKAFTCFVSYHNVSVDVMVFSHEIAAGHLQMGAIV